MVLSCTPHNNISDDHFAIIQCYNFQLPQYQSRSVIMELLQQQDKVISSHVVYLELKISALPLPIDGLGTVAVGRLKLEPTPTLSPSLHYDWLMLLVMLVKSPSVQATLQEIIL